MIYEPVEAHCKTLIKEFYKIPSKRKKILGNIAAYIASKTKKNEPCQLIYICTHNSRRSHFGQVWAMVAGAY